MSKCAITQASSSSAALRLRVRFATAAQDDTLKAHHDTIAVVHSYLVARALEYCADRFDIARVVGFPPRRFENRRFVAQLGARRQRAKPVEAYVAFADVMVAIPVSTHR